MPDTRRNAATPPRDWPQALSALPQETPPAGGWHAIAATLDKPHKPHTRLPLWLATAATLLLAIALPWRLLLPTGTDREQATTPTPTTEAVDPFQSLYDESARLETLLAVARDDRVASGTAAMLAGELDLRLATIDAALAQPGLSREDRLLLWQQRVDSLRTFAGFESNRRWLSSQGMPYQTALVHVD